jgi:hypothetical protein
VIDGRIAVTVFGHALLEHALTPGKLLVGKALVFEAGPGVLMPHLADATATATDAGRMLADPLELRPLPLSGIPGWHPDNGDEAFHHTASCYQPRRAGRSDPAALQLPK